MEKNESLDRWAVVAQYMTVGAALLTVALWAFTAVLVEPAEWGQLLMGILFVVMVVGGLTLGVLYLARTTRRG